MKFSKNLLWLVAFGILAALALTGCSQSWSNKELETEKTAVNLVREAARGGYQIIPTEEMKAWIEQKKDLRLIDTMPYEDSYKKQHVPGAVPYEFPIPEVKEMDEAAKAKFAKVLGPDQDKLLVFYCGFTKCTRSHNGAMWAMKLGYKNVYRYPGGIKAWMEAGYPVEKAEK
jgi:thiosulfate/3-mercaptopyruvate sulfurtransferase